MLKPVSKKRSREVAIRQKARPDLAQLNEYLLQVLERVGERIKFTWLSRNSEQEFELILHANSTKKEAQWQLSVVANHQRTIGLWSYSTCDVLLIHNLIVTSCGDDETAVRAEGAISASSSFRESSRNNSAYFVTAVDDSASIADSKKSTKKSTLKNVLPPADGESSSALNSQSASTEVNAFQKLIESAKELAIADLPQTPSKAVDRSMIETVRTSLRDVQTGFHFYPAFLYELEQEYIRCFRNGAALSVVLMRVRSGADADKELEQAEFARVARILSALKRGSDLIGYYESGGDVVALLPETSAQGAHIFARRVAEKIASMPQLGVLAESEFKVRIGVASIPEDCKNLGILLGIAERGLERAIRSGASMIVPSERDKLPRAVGR